VDLLVVSTLSLVLVPFVYVVPLEPVRIALGLPFVLLFPGYTLIAALFPRREDLGGVERLVFSLGLSLTVVPLFGLALNFTPWGIRLTPIVLALSIWVLTLSGLTHRRRLQLSPQERFSIPWPDILQWVKASRRPIDVTVGVFLGLSVLVLVGAVGYRMLQPNPEGAFTEFYVLGAEGKLQDLPSRLRVGEAETLNVGIINQEQLSVTYTVEGLLNGNPVGSAGPLELDHGVSWEQDVIITPVEVGDVQKLELLLYQEGMVDSYRTLHLWVDVLPRW
jgi:uncharacterized membrane protein